MNINCWLSYCMVRRKWYLTLMKANIRMRSYVSQFTDVVLMNGISLLNGLWQITFTLIMFVGWFKYHDSSKCCLLIFNFTYFLPFFATDNRGYSIHSDIYKSKNLINNFEEILINIYQPLFETTNDPASHPELHQFLQYVRVFGCCYIIWLPQKWKVVYVLRTFSPHKLHTLLLYNKTLLCLHNVSFHYCILWLKTAS